MNREEYTASVMRTEHSLDYQYSFSYDDVSVFFISSDDENSPNPIWVLGEIGINHSIPLQNLFSRCDVEYFGGYEYQTRGVMKK